MILLDVNVLIYAYRDDAIDHVKYRTWLQRTLDSNALCGLPDLVLSSFVRITTNPKIWRAPADIDAAFEYANWLRSHPACLPVSPGEQHWEIFMRLCRSVGAKGNMVSDAYLAALAIESGAEWITTDRDYARFPGLRWRHPLA